MSASYAFPAQHTCEWIVIVTTTRYSGPEIKNIFNILKIPKIAQKVVLRAIYAR